MSPPFRQILPRRAVHQISALSRSHQQGDGGQGDDARAHRRGPVRPSRSGRRRGRAFQLARSGGACRRSRAGPTRSRSRISGRSRPPGRTMRWAQNPGRQERREAGTSSFRSTLPNAASGGFEWRRPPSRHCSGSPRRPDTDWIRWRRCCGFWSCWTRSRKTRCFRSVSR